MIVLYECPPLRAKITERVCQANAARAERAAHAKHGTPAYLAGIAFLRTCPGCPGVRELGRPVERIAGSEGRRARLGRRHKPNPRTQLGAEWAARRQDVDGLTPLQRRVVEAKRRQPRASWQQVGEAVGRHAAICRRAYEAAIPRLRKVRERRKAHARRGQ